MLEQIIRVSKSAQAQHETVVSAINRSNALTHLIIGTVYEDEESTKNKSQKENHFLIKTSDTLLKGDSQKFSVETYNDIHCNNTYIRIVSQGSIFLYN